MPPKLSSTSLSRRAPSEDSKLRVQLLLERADQFVVRFENPGTEPVIILRPASGELLERVPGRPGFTQIPAPEYYFEAVNTSTRVVHKGVYAPLWPMVQRQSAVDEESGAPLQVAWDHKRQLDPHDHATQEVDLPFELPPGRYQLRFSYEYQQAADDVPRNWFTGVARSQPLEHIVR